LQEPVRWHAVCHDGAMRKCLLAHGFVRGRKKNGCAVKYSYQQQAVFDQCVKLIGKFK
jgi:hypothetical protein